MILLEINGIPVPWKAHGGFGKRAFNHRKADRERVQWFLRAQYNQNQLLCGPIRVSYSYYVPIPKGTSKARKLQMLNGLMHPIKRPDVDNFNKFLSDCLTGIIWEDDSQVVELTARKLYGDTPKTVIRVESING